MEVTLYSSFRMFFEELIGDLIFGRSTNKLSLRVLATQIYFTGFEALGVVLISSFALGVSLIWGGQAITQNLGQSEIFYSLIISGFITDIAPVVISLILLLRSGSAITTELGYMKVNQEIAALRTIGISPVSYLISPRVIGCVLSALILCVYFAFSGIVLAYLCSSLIFNLQYEDFFRGVLSSLKFADIVIMGAKVSLSSFCLTVICCYQGLQVQDSFTDIPKRVIKALSWSLFGIILVNSSISLIRFLL
jgi:phospholipid/cholesterol/gamma-HCH transport system permease protein